MEDKQAQSLIVLCQKKHSAYCSATPIGPDFEGPAQEIKYYF